MMQKHLNDPVIWRRLHEEHVGLGYLFKDHLSCQWFALARYPWLPDDRLPWWCNEYDSRTTLMGRGKTPVEAVLGLFDHPNREKPEGLGRAVAALTCEIANLIATIRR